MKKWLANLRVFPGENGQQMAELTWARTNESASRSTTTDLSLEMVVVRDDAHLKELQRMFEAGPTYGDTGLN
jgi:hypothetical protein